MTHTLDAMQALLVSSWNFPSRLSAKSSSQVHFANVSRRLYRLLAHARIHHVKVYTDFELETKCTIRLQALARRYGLMDETTLGMLPKL